MATTTATITLASSDIGDNALSISNVATLYTAGTDTGITETTGLARKKFATNSNTPVPTSVGISSGTAVPSLIFAKVGLFDESLFIDYVDTEWFLRCRFYSIAVLVIPRAVLKHRIGDSNIEKQYIKLHIHSSKRVYYQVRNSIAMLWIPHIPLIFSMREVTVTLIHKLFQTLYIEEKCEHLRHILKGIFHGIAGRSGSI